MVETQLALQFGISIDPRAAAFDAALEHARLADEQGLDLITVMDHPYNVRLFDTWTLMTALALNTDRVRIAANVLSLPLRPPAVLAKQAATLDVMSNGRLEMGLGAGAYWDGISAIGGPRRTPGEAYQAFEDALMIMRGMWDNAGKSFSYAGDVYQVTGVRPGPVPAHRIPIWVGARGPRMLRLLGRMADGLFTSYNYESPDHLNFTNQHIDEGTEQAGRVTTEVRRGYNLMGVIDTGHDDTRVSGLKGDAFNAPVGEWVDRIITWHQDYRQDTFIFWPAAGNKVRQIEAFTQEVIPAVQATVLQES